MAKREWPLEEPWDTWTLADLTVTDAKLVVSDGKTSGTATSAVQNCTPWTGWMPQSIVGERAVGTRYAYQCRVGTSLIECNAATWSEWIDGVDTNGVITFDLGTYADNHAAFAVGPYIQHRIKLVTD